MPNLSTPSKNITPTVFDAKIKCVVVLTCGDENYLKLNIYLRDWNDFENVAAALVPLDARPECCLCDQRTQSLHAVSIIVG